MISYRLAAEGLEVRSIVSEVFSEKFDIEGFGWIRMGGLREGIDEVQ